MQNGMLGTNFPEELDFGRSDFGVTQFQQDRGCRDEEDQQRDHEEDRSIGIAADAQVFPRGSAGAWWF
jgi:hypothetical protein